MTKPSAIERDLVKCEDMRLHARHAIEFLGDRSLEALLDDALTQAAVIRCVEVVGEAARLGSSDTQQRAPDIPWSLIVGMRHVLAHDYSGVMLDKVHKVVRTHLPDLLEHLEPLIASLEVEVGWQD